MAGANGTKAKEPQELPGVPVDGAFYTVDDLTGKEQRELRDVMRETTGNETATLNTFLNFGLVDDFDFTCGLTYIIKRRTDPSYTLDQALELKPTDITEAGQELLKEQRRRPRKPASSGT